MWVLPPLASWDHVAVGMAQQPEDVRRTFADAEEASQFLIAEQSVCCVPWDDAGPYLRFSVTYTAATEADEDALMAETVRRLTGLNLRF